MSQNEIQERVANLNTQLRFGRKRAALEAAYKLRTFIQLSGYQSEDALNELQRAEQIIAELERNQISSVQKWIGALVRTIQRSLNPEVDTDDESLLEQFKSKPEHPALEEEEDLESDRGRASTRWP